MQHGRRESVDLEETLLFPRQTHTIRWVDRRTSGGRFSEKAQPSLLSSFRKNSENLTVEKAPWSILSSSRLDSRLLSKMKGSHVSYYNLVHSPIWQICQAVFRKLSGAYVRPVNEHHSQGGKSSHGKTKEWVKLCQQMCDQCSAQGWYRSEKMEPGSFALWDFAVTLWLIS